MLLTASISRRFPREKHGSFCFFPTSFLIIFETLDNFRSVWWRSRITRCKWVPMSFEKIPHWKRETLQVPSTEGNTYYCEFWKWQHVPHQQLSVSRWLKQRGGSFSKYRVVILRAWQGSGEFQASPTMFEEALGYWDCLWREVQKLFKRLAAMPGKSLKELRRLVWPSDD